MSERLKEELRERCKELGINMMGVAPADRWDDPPFLPWIPEEFRPKAIFPEGRSVVVIGLPVTLPVLETSPSIHYHQLYKTINEILDQSTYWISNFLNDRGHASLFIPRDGYGHIQLMKERALAFFSHRHAAYLAGLGTFGLNNMVLTKEYGPRVRFGSVITSAELPGDPVMEEQLCTRCLRCVDNCPVKAFTGVEFRADEPRQKRFDAFKCSEYRRDHPCGICVSSCPRGSRPVRKGKGLLS